MRCPVIICHKDSCDKCSTKNKITLQEDLLNKVSDEDLVDYIKNNFINSKAEIFFKQNTSIFLDNEKVFKDCVIDELQKRNKEMKK